MSKTPFTASQVGSFVSFGGAMHGDNEFAPAISDHCFTAIASPSPGFHGCLAKFHWHVEDKGIRHAYIKPSSPQLNGKVERSHRSDEQEFYQLLTYKGDVDLEAKLDEWERFYNPVS